MILMLYGFKKSFKARDSCSRVTILNKNFKAQEKCQVGGLVILARRGDSHINMTGMFVVLLKVMLHETIRNDDF